MSTPIDLIVTRLHTLRPLTSVEQLLLRVRLASLFALDKDEHGYGSNKRSEGGEKGDNEKTTMTKAWTTRLVEKDAENAHHAKVGAAINALIEEHGVDWLGALVKMPAHERARRGLPQAA